ncbi:hypothetical protein CTAYLR_006816 [Chrysophaeum taylorii]|uniref:Uncharacterized protein n=1 Tax=Chrysophaeum taylorii TaxID=2483200 RepID=A0AAD7UDL5_9STRA|nr:hypothetical protein CTAYLR_006816 [Chrysophaeum taylorii]
MSRRCLAMVGVIVATHLASTFVVIPVPLNVVVTASAIVYLGAARSLKFLLEKPITESDAKRKRREESVRLSSGDAMRFPLIGSVFLVTTYLLIKLFGRHLLNLLLTLYFAAFGAVVVESAFESEILDLPWVQARDWPVCVGALVAVRPAILAKFVGTSIDLRLTAPQAACWVLSCGMIASYAFTKHWLLNNAIATSLAVSALESISVGSFRNAAIMLSGLFVYDIYWVFGTEVMVTVAKGIDGPIKFLFVRSLDGPNFSMLGVGDVVVPGLLVALLLRYDARNADHDGSRGDVLVGTFDAPYFRATMLAYVAGLATTLYVMYAFDAAQPALLYLVPSVLGAALLRAALSANLKHLVAYSEEAAKPPPNDDTITQNQTPKADDDDDDDGGSSSKKTM